MTSILLASYLIGQKDFMNPKRFTGTIKKVEFTPYATLTIAVPDIKKPLVLTARGIALFEDTALKRSAVAKIKKEFLGKNFVAIVAENSKSALQDAISTERELRFPGALYVEGLLYADANSPINDDQRRVAQKSGHGFYRLTPKEQAHIVMKTQKYLKKKPAK